MIVAMERFQDTPQKYERSFNSSFSIFMISENFGRRNAETSAVEILAIFK